MFWSKIWFFAIAVLAAIALTLALVMPRPAQRAHETAEHKRLIVACEVVSVLLKDNARTRVALAGTFARERDVVARLEEAGGKSEISADDAKAARDVGNRLIEAVEGLKPDFAILVDRRGRVLARSKVGEQDFGDVVAGRPLIDDALTGYLRDDLWIIDNRLYLVAAAPVIRGEYIGAVVLGHAVTNELAQRLSKNLDIGVGFYLHGDPVASTSATPLDKDRLDKAFGAIKGGEIPLDCEANKPFELRAGKDDVMALIARLPGEAQRAKAFHAIFIKRPAEIGFSGTLGAVQKGDLGFGSFPWILVGGGLVLALVVGLGLMIFEADRPMRRLNADAVRLAKGEVERLEEDKHRGKLGSIARSINIHIDKLGRDAKSAKKDLDQLLGPVPEGSLGAIDILGTSMPGRPAPPPGPPPPSEFRFGDSSPKVAAPAGPAAPGLDLGPAPGAARQTPPGMGRPTPATGRPIAPAVRPPGMPPRAPTPPPVAKGLDDDLLGRDINPETASLSVGPGTAIDNPYYKQVFDQFVALKKSCNEPTTGLTFGKFSEKLQRNRDELMQKTGCRDVRFTVYVKDGKAALKATPVKED